MISSALSGSWVHYSTELIPHMYIYTSLEWHARHNQLVPKSPARSEQHLLICTVLSSLIRCTPALNLHESCGHHGYRCWASIDQTMSRDAVELDIAIVDKQRYNPCRPKYFILGVQSQSSMSARRSVSRRRRYRDQLQRSRWSGHQLTSMRGLSLIEEPGETVRVYML